MDLYVMENFLFDAISDVSALEALQKRLDFDLQQIETLASDKKATLPSTYAVVKERTDYDPKTDDENLTSDSDAALD